MQSTAPLGVLSQAIIDLSSGGLFVCDARANVICVNPASERIHKIIVKELIGKNMVDLIEEGVIENSGRCRQFRTFGYDTEAFTRAKVG